MPLTTSPQGAAPSAGLPELLAPAGGPDAFAAAIAAGADAVYVGTGELDARAAAQGFGDEELAAAVAVAHAHGARVYVTLNALVDEGRLDRALDRARAIAATGADALIVADLGLMRALRDDAPAGAIEVHLSTQAGAQSPEAVRFAARELGVSRVTCSRELSLPEIALLTGTGVPIEMFCHGAICISYSGACAYSALRRGRSASRGDCTQPCRVPYDLVDDAGESGRRVKGDKLLCPHDYLALGHLRELCRMGVASLKIEGRMKNPDYVYNVVSVWRRALDALARGEAPDTASALFELGRSFNRGFTDAYLRGASGAELMSFERSCNQGVFVGRVAERRRHEIDVALEAPVNAGDLLEVRSAPGPEAGPDVPERWPQVPCAVDAGAGETITVRCKRKVRTGAPVNLTRSAPVLSAAERALAPVRAELDGLLADRAAARGAAPTTDGRSRAHARPARPEGSGRATIQAAPSAPLQGPAAPATSSSPDGSPVSRLVVAASPGEAAALLARHGAASSARGDAPEVAVFAWRLDDDDAWRPLLGRLTVILDEVFRPGDAARVGGLARAAARVVCRNMGQIDPVRDAGAPFDVAAPLSCWNGAALRAARAWGARRAWVPDELPDAAAARLAGAAPDGLELGLLVDGAPELMVTEHCVLTAMGPCSGDCAACRRRRERFFLREGSGAELPVHVDARGRTRIFDERPVDRRGLLGELSSVRPVTAAEIRPSAAPSR